MAIEPQTKSRQSLADNLENRLVDFSVRIINLSTNLPRTPAGRHIAGQIMRSGTSPAPNYGEARGAESHAIFSQAPDSSEGIKRNINLASCY